jgi:hypothetical protein
MTREKYLRLMKFPKEWETFNLMPEDLLDQLIGMYVPGHEDSSEHDRNGVFHWWLKQSPDKEVLMKLVNLSFLDPDQIMAKDVRGHILRSTHADEDVIGLIRRGTN